MGVIILQRRGAKVFPEPNFADRVPSGSDFLQTGTIHASDPIYRNQIRTKNLFSLVSNLFTIRT